MLDSLCMQASAGEQRVRRYGESCWLSRSLVCCGCSAAPTHPAKQRLLLLLLLLQQLPAAMRLHQLVARQPVHRAELATAPELSQPPSCAAANLPLLLMLLLLLMGEG
jgi:hypothetical protein